MEEGRPYEADINELSGRGDGLARIDGFVTFVPDTRLGKHVKIEILQVSDRFAIGERIEQALSQG